MVAKSNSITIPLPTEKGDQALLSLLGKGIFNGWFVDAELRYAAQAASNVVPGTTLQQCSNGPRLIGDPQKCADIYTGVKTVEKVRFDLVLLSNSQVTGQFAVCITNGYSGNVSFVSNAYQNEVRWHLEKVEFHLSYLRDSGTATINPQRDVRVGYQPEYGGEASRPGLDCPLLVFSPAFGANLFTGDNRLQT